MSGLNVEAAKTTGSPFMLQYKKKIAFNCVDWSMGYVIGGRAYLSYWC